MQRDAEIHTSFVVEVGQGAACVNVTPNSCTKLVSSPAITVIFNLMVEIELYWLSLLEIHLEDTLSSTTVCSEYKSMLGEIVTIKTVPL